MSEKEKVDRNCNKCKYTDNPCSECDEDILDKWESPDSKNETDRKIWNTIHDIFLGCGFNWEVGTDYIKLYKKTGLSLTDYLLFKILLKLNTNE